MAKKSEEKAKESDQIAVQLRYEFPENLSVAAFANHMLVQLDENDFHISFFQVTPPIILGSESERREQAHKLGQVPAKCVARIVVAEGLLPKIIEALQTNLANKRKQGPALANGHNKSHDKTA